MFHPISSSGVDKAAYWVCTRKFSASTLENNFKISGTLHSSKVMCTRAYYLWYLFTTSPILSCRRLFRIITQNKVSDNIEKNKTVSTIRGRTLINIITKNKVSEVWIKNGIFHDRFSFMMISTEK